MAQTIVTLCDHCLVELDQQVAAQAYRLGIELPGERWRWVEIDLCPDHASGLTDLSLMADKFGRTFQPDGGAPSSSLVCPDCGKAYTSKSGLHSHRQKKHPESAAAVPASQARICPQCGRTFDSAQGLSMHVRRSHEGFDPNSG